MQGHVIKTTQIRDRKDKREERSDTGRVKRMWATEKNGCDNKRPKYFERTSDRWRQSNKVCVHYKSVLIVLASYQVASNPCAIWKGNYKVDPGACGKEPF